MEIPAFFPPWCSLYSKLLTLLIYPHAVSALSWVRHHFRYLVWPFQGKCGISSQWDHHQVKPLSSYLCPSLNRSCYVQLHLKFLNTELGSKLACLPREPVIWYHLLQRGMEAPQHLLCKDGNGQDAWNVDGSKLTVFSTGIC